ncbi:MAG TPA: zinc-binding dehydrogenase [Anaerolineae bacterium]|nr:zinc-binding dehydrogenase [Anaerolineae bacterium]
MPRRGVTADRTQSPDRGRSRVLPRPRNSWPRHSPATSGRGVDKSLDCSGVVAAERFCIDATRRKGQVAFVGECPDELKIRVSPDMIRKGLTMRGCWY